MEYTYLGKTGLKVSRLCLGTMNFGTTTSEEEAFRIMDAALEAGINFFDTANCYGHPEGRDIDTHAGLTEEIIGRWFDLGGGRRERVVLATKAYYAMDDPLDGPNDANGISAYKMRRALEGSLKRLHTDHVELYQVHHYDPHCSFDELFETFESLIAQGKVVYAGSCNHGARHMAYAKAAAEKRHFTGYVCEQHRYSLLCRQPELEVLPCALELGEGVVCYNPLHAGMLSGHVLTAKPGTRGEKLLKRMTEPQREQLEKYSALCREYGMKEAEAAQAWVLSHPAVTAVLTGPRTLEQFESSLNVLDITLPEEMKKALDEIFPPAGKPGKTAPEAYAW